MSGVFGVKFFHIDNICLGLDLPEYFFHIPVKLFSQRKLFYSFVSFEVSLCIRQLDDIVNKFHNLSVVIATLLQLKFDSTFVNQVIRIFINVITLQKLTC